MSDSSNSDEPSSVIQFPYSRATPASGGQPTRYLGMGQMAQQLGIPERQATGHWCSRCHGIWYGYLLEVACPACGNRHG